MKTYLKNNFVNDEDIQRLIGIDGIDYFSAAVVISEIADINRFRSFNRLCAYSGLAPRVSQSGSKAAIHGPLMANRRKNLQWILLEVVYHFINASFERKKRFEELKRRKGFNTARIIMARQLLKVIYHVLKDKRPYYCDYAERTVVKINKIQSKAAAALSGV